jgi:hypothetical protein
MQAPKIKTLNVIDATIDEIKTWIKNGWPISGITTLATHRKPHFEEALGFYGLRNTKFGERKFPGIKNATIAFYTNLEMNAYELSGEDGFYEAISRGCLITGMAGGFFDEHRLRSDVHPSSAQMIFDYLGITKDPDYKKVFSRLLLYANYEDRNGDSLEMFCEPEKDVYIKRAAQALLPASLMKSAWKTVSHDDTDAQDRVLKVVFEMIDFEVKAQEQFYVHAKKAFEEAKKSIVPTGLTNVKGKDPVILFLYSDNESVAGYARFMFNTNQEQKLAVVVTVNSKNQICIQPHADYKSEMNEAIKMMRTAILDAKKIRIPDWNILDAEGSIIDADEIHYHKDAGNIYNGTLRETDIPGIYGTLLTKADILWALKTAFNATAFKSEFASMCQLGNCAKVRCGWYLIGLDRCKKVRAGKRSKTASTFSIGDAIQSSQSKKPQEQKRA